ncbi:MAG: FG-GAP repeat domain-containing protein, partial [Planctomycetaceae bacterium]
MFLTFFFVAVQSLLQVPADSFPAAFKAQTIDPEAGRVVYAVTPADVDGDGDQDIVALTESSVIWYQQPGWGKRVILRDQTPPDNVCIAAHDIDGDGRVDFALGA